MKKYTIITIILVGLILGFFTGIYLYKIKQISNNDKTEEIAELIEDECTAIAQLSSQGELISTNSSNPKISPNCTIILKIYYKKCEHIVEKKENVEEVQVNLTEEELKQKFTDWEIQKFTPTEIVLYKEIDGFCGEHYLLKEKDENIAVFSLDENNNEAFIENTDISVKYLEEEDLNKIKNGIYVYSKKELNKTLEDFE